MMKKALVVLLALTMVFAFAACGEQAESTADEGITAIPLGGNLPDLSLEDDAFGTYVEMDFPEGTDLSEASEAHLYYAEGSATPCIEVIRWKNEDGKTLEEEIAALCEKYDSANYQIGNWEEIGNVEAGYYTVGYTDSDGNYYYVECDLMLDGDEFVEIDFYYATDEFALGETGQYLWIPTGYSDLMSDEELEHGTVFYGKYSEAHFLPQIWVGPFPTDYEEFCWYLSSLEEPIDEASFNKWMAADWDEASCDEYYEALGITDVELFTGESNGLQTYVYAGNYGSSCVDDIYIRLTEGTYYNIFLYSENTDPYPLYAKVLLDSLHSK